MTQFWPKPHGKKLQMPLPRLPIEYSVTRSFSPFMELEMKDAAVEGSRDTESLDPSHPWQRASRVTFEQKTGFSV